MIYPLPSSNFRLKLRGSAGPSAWKPVLTLDLLLHIVLLLLNSCKSVSEHSESGPLIESHISKLVKVNLVFRNIKTPRWLLHPMRMRLCLALPQSSVPGPQENAGGKKSFLYHDYSISQYLFFPKCTSLSNWLFHFYFTLHSQWFVTSLKLSSQNLMKIMAL